MNHCVVESLQSALDTTDLLEHPSISSTEASCKKPKDEMQVLEGKIKLISEGETDLYNEFPDLTRGQVNTTRGQANTTRGQANTTRGQANTMSIALSNPCTINDLYFEHMWFIDGRNVMYNGHIISVKTSGKYKIPKVTLEG